jgi:hypothetical protein
MDVFVGCDDGPFLSRDVLEGATANLVKKYPKVL